MKANFDNSPVRIIGLGETVLDIIFRDNIPVSAMPGGSVLNSMVSLGRCGIPSLLVSEAGNDEPGRLIEGFLEKNNVRTTFLQVYEKHNTPVALAFLNHDRDASYTFYRNFPEQRLTEAFPEPGPGDIVLFGSYFAISDATHEKVAAFAGKARVAGSLVVYDPNFRKPHLGELAGLKPRIMKNLALADIVRGSDEDFLHIFGVENAGDAYRIVKEQGCKFLILTKNRMGADLVAGNTSVHVDSPAIDPVSTIGAGDAFNAGLIRYLLRNGLCRDDLLMMEKDHLRELVAEGIRFSTAVCMTWENYIPHEFIKELEL
jgi:fructokinase